MTDEPPISRASFLRNLLNWITEAHSAWRLTVVIVLGASVLVGTLIWKHPEWITMLLQARLGGTPPQ